MSASPHRRTRNRLSIGEIDAVWIYTVTARKFRFHDGQWECSGNVYYGKDSGWFRWGQEPRASEGHVFLEMPADQQVDDPEFAKIASRYHEDTRID